VVVRVRGVFSSGGLGAWAAGVPRNKGSYYKVYTRFLFQEAR
jgi:hypothetical protein